MGGKAVTNTHAAAPPIFRESVSGRRARLAGSVSDSPSRRRQESGLTGYMVIVLVEEGVYWTYDAPD